MPAAGRCAHHAADDGEAGRIIAVACAAGRWPRKERAGDRHADRQAQPTRAIAAIIAFYRPISRRLAGDAIAAAKKETSSMLSRFHPLKRIMASIRSFLVICRRQPIEINSAHAPSMTTRPMAHAVGRATDAKKYYLPPAEYSRSAANYLNGASSILSMMACGKCRRSRGRIVTFVGGKQRCLFSQWRRARLVDAMMPPTRRRESCRATWPRQHLPRDAR